MKSSQRNKAYLVRDAIVAIAAEEGEIVSYDSIRTKLEGKMGKDDIDDSIRKLKEKGDIFETQFVGNFLGGHVGVNQQPPCFQHNSFMNDL